MSELVLILVLTVVVPLVLVLHYVTKWRTAKGLTNEDAAALLRPLLPD